MTNKIEEAVVSYNHDAKGTLDGVLVNGTTVHEILQSIPGDRGYEILEEVKKLLQDGMAKMTLHDLLTSYVASRNNSLVIRRIEEETIFLFLLGQVFLSETGDMHFATMLAKRILVGSQEKQSITQTIEEFCQSYNEETEKETPMPLPVISILMLGLFGATVKLMKNPMFMLSLLIEGARG